MEHLQLCLWALCYCNVFVFISLLTNRWNGHDTITNWFTALLLHLFQFVYAACVRVNVYEYDASKQRLCLQLSQAEHSCKCSMLIIIDGKMETLDSLLFKPEIQLSMHTFMQTRYIFRVFGTIKMLWLAIFEIFNSDLFLFSSGLFWCNTVDVQKS